MIDFGSGTEKKEIKSNFDDAGNCLMGRDSHTTNNLLPPMTKQRKTKQPASNKEPMLKPSDIQSNGSQKPLIEISEEEQWRLINESGVLKNIPRPIQTAQAGPADDGQQDSPSLGEEILDTILYTIPFSFLLLMMEMCVVCFFRGPGGTQAHLA